ncbi:thermonuclease family protein [Croceicoccus sediminis]|uniref:thermonuclease family protein n=1 Tax=Croceicoccus sediminis TaxID=2571150 RepID=UPI001F10256D|nr:thermonuclease family protein [Croceicoccus sediminis]
MPLKGKNGRPIRFRKPRSKGPTLKFWDKPVIKKKKINWWAIALAIGSVVLIGYGVSMGYGPMVIGTGTSYSETSAAPLASPEDTLYANFGICDGGKRQNCVVDGDTFWFAGEKYRVLDINTPEISNPQCDRELALGRAATQRFRQLINDGPFSLESGPEETDRYGRKLRRVMRGGQSLGDILVAQGLAETWQGHRSGWC